MGGSSSNLKNGIVFEIDDTIVKEGEKNYVQLDIGNINTQNPIKDCLLIPDTKYSGGQNNIDIHGLAVKDSKCGKIDDEKYYSTCFLTPKNISVKGVRNPEKCKILYKAELKCEDNTLITEDFRRAMKDNARNGIDATYILKNINETKNLCEIVPIDGTPKENEHSCNNSNVVDKYNKKWTCEYSSEDNTCNSIGVIEVIESFVNNSDNNMGCIIIAIILLIVFLYL